GKTPCDVYLDLDGVGLEADKRAGVRGGEHVFGFVTACVRRAVHAPACFHGHSSGGVAAGGANHASSIERPDTAPGGGPSAERSTWRANLPHLLIAYSRRPDNSIPWTRCP